MGPEWLRLSTLWCCSCGSYVFPQCWGRHFHPRAAQAQSVRGSKQVTGDHQTRLAGRWDLGSWIPAAVAQADVPHSLGRLGFSRVAHSCGFLRATAPAHLKLLYPLTVGSENLKPGRAKNQWNVQASCGAGLQPLHRAPPRSTFPPETWSLGNGRGPECPTLASHHKDNQAQSGQYV